MRRPWHLVTLAFLLACGADEADPMRADRREPAPVDGPPSERVRMGPLANAGPDQRALPGMVVRLDGRGTVPPEDGRPFRYLWLQEAGPRVHLSDPTSVVTDFVAPPIRPAEALDAATDRLVFRLIVDDGAFRRSDRVAIQLVESSDELASAPAVVAGADLEAAPSEEVELPPPSFLSPSCPAEEDPGCSNERLPFCWTQVAGPAVELSGACEPPTRFVAPAFESLLIFRVDAHERGLHDPEACGPEDLLPRESPLCAAPDYLRVVVRQTPRRVEPPTTWLRVRDEERERVEAIEIGGPAAEIPELVELAAGGWDPERWTLVGRFRPVLGRLDLPPDASPLRLPTPTWPGPVGIAFDPWFYRHHTQGGQTRMEWVRAAPFLAVIHWRSPADSLPLAGNAGPRPCGPTSPSRVCEPLVPGQEVVLSGRFEGGGAQGCWEQTYGPMVDLVPSARCVTGSAERRFVAPAPAGDEPLELAFRFTVRDAGPYESRPSTLWLQVRPEDVPPPWVEVAAPASLAPGASAELNASASTDPQGGPLLFRWRQLEGPAVQLRDCDDDGQGACKVLTAPLEAEGRLLLEVEVASAASRLLTSRRIEIPLEARP